MNGILVVDDDRNIALLNTKRVELLGYQATTQTDSQEAINFVHSHPEDFDLIITDQMMPNKTGEELAREITASHPDIPIILCTGYSDRIDAEKARSIGIKAFLLKPVTTEELANTIRNVLDNF